MKNGNYDKGTPCGECLVADNYTLINSGKKLNAITTNRILLFKVLDNYTSIILYDSTEYVTSDSLRSLEQQLPSYFYRISRSFIINVNYVKSIRKKTRCIL